MACVHTIVVLRGDVVNLSWPELGALSSPGAHLQRTRTGVAMNMTITT